MNISLKNLLPVLALSAISFGGTFEAQAQKKPVKEANKINEKRNDLKSDRTGIDDDKYDYDSEFVVAAASSNMLHMALGNLAQQKAIATEVRDWGKQMEEAHGGAEQMLREIAYREKITLPGAMGREAYDAYQDVDDRKYLGFDKKYLRTLKDLHERDLKLYSEAATKLHSPALQQYAARMLPQLRQHQQALEPLYERASDRK